MLSPLSPLSPKTMSTKRTPKKAWAVFSSSVATVGYSLRCSASDIVIVVLVLVPVPVVAVRRTMALTSAAGDDGEKSAVVAQVDLAVSVDVGVIVAVVVVVAAGGGFEKTTSSSPAVVAVE